MAKASKRKGAADDAIPDNEKWLHEPRAREALNKALAYESENRAKRGRPVGSGAQLPAIERTRASRSKRAETGAIRLDLTLDTPESRAALTELMTHWKCKSRKEAVERALLAAVTTIRG